MGSYKPLRSGSWCLHKLISWHRVHKRGGKCTGLCCCLPSPSQGGDAILMPSHCHAPTRHPTTSPAQAVMSGVHRGWRAGAAAGTPFPPVFPGPMHPEVPTSLPPFSPPSSSPDSSSPTAQPSHSQFFCHFHTCPWELTWAARGLLCISMDLAVLGAF